MEREQRTPAAPAAPGPGEATVYEIDLDAPGRANPAALDPAELVRADRFATPALRRRYVAAHAALREVLGRHLGVRPAAVAIERLPCWACGEPHGRPVLAGDGRGLSFSLAHSEGTALVAVARGCEVGVDVEVARSAAVAAALEHEVLGAEERAELRALAPGERARACLAQWTRKEAVLKACGAGLNVPMTEVRIPLSPTAAGCRDAIACGRRWAVGDLAPARGAGALAASSALRRVRHVRA